MNSERLFIEVLWLLRRARWQQCHAINSLAPRPGPARRAGNEAMQSTTWVWRHK